MSGAGVVDGTLYILGTDGRDDIKVKAKNGNQFLEVDAKLSREDRPNDRKIKQTFSRAGISRIVVITYAGDDKVDLKLDSPLRTSVSIAAIVLGGAGNDNLRSEDGNSILVGGDGDDHLTGRDDRSVLIEGNGRDNIRGGQGGDVLIGGSMAYGEDLDALDQALATWNSHASYDHRVTDLLATRLIPRVTVFDDGASDNLQGQRGRDWYIGNFRNASGSKDKPRIEGRKWEWFVQLPERDGVLSRGTQGRPALRGLRFLSPLRQLRRTDQHRPRLQRAGGQGDHPRWERNGLKGGPGLVR